MCRIVLIYWLALWGCPVWAQTPLSLADAEKALQKNNLQLLAQQYQVSAAKATIIQARIWPQPYVYGEVNLYNPDQGNYFDVGAQGQKSMALSQLIQMGGKRRHQIEWAKANAQAAELEFEQLLYRLNFELKTQFYNLYFDRQVLDNLQRQIDQIADLVDAYSIQANKGNVALKELVRLESLLLNLKNDRITFERGILAYEQNLALLTGLQPPFQLQLTDADAWTLHYSKDLGATDGLYTQALSRNPEYRLLQQQLAAQNSQVKYQKSLSVPDVTLGVSYDQRGGAFNNQKNLTLGLPIPLWNSNKGNIEAAKAQVQAAQAQVDQKALELKTSLEAALKQWQLQRRQFLSIKPELVRNREQVYKGVWENFQKRNITLLEFTDFMDSYTQNSLQINEANKQLILSAEQLNYIVNQPLF